MNILIEGGDLNPPFAEGTRNIALTHALELKRRGHNVSIFTKNKDLILNKKHPKTEIINGLNFYRWKSYPDLFFTYRKIIKKEKIDLVHIFIKGTRPSLYLYFLKKGGGRNIPVIFSLLGWPGRKYKSLEKASKVVVPSKPLKNFLKLKNSISIPYGIETSKFKPESKKEDLILCLRFPSTAFLEAFKELSLENSNVKLLLNKKNINNRKEIRTIIKKLDIKNCEEIGHVDHMEDLFKRSKIVVDTHYGKDLHYNKFLRCASPPLLILESMASEMGVISNNIPEIKDIIEHKKTGFLVNPTDKKQIYSALKELLKNKKIGINARKETTEKFDIEKVILKYEKIYQDLCEFQ